MMFGQAFGNLFGIRNKAAFQGGPRQQMNTTFDASYRVALGIDGTVSDALVRAGQKPEDTDRAWTTEWAIDLLPVENLLYTPGCVRPSIMTATSKKDYVPHSHLTNPHVGGLHEHVSDLGLHLDGYQGRSTRCPTVDDAWFAFLDCWHHGLADYPDPTQTHPA